MSIVWTQEENSLILDFVAKNGKQWNLISNILPHRTTSQISAHYEHCLDPTLIKGPFSSEEDQIIIEYVKQYGCQDWILIKNFLPNRTPKQCRERWCNNLDPNINKTGWTQSEDEFIFRYISQYGPKWSNLSKLIPGRTDNAIKNRYHSSIAKRITVNPMTGLNELAPPKSKKKNQNTIQLHNEVHSISMSPTTEKRKFVIPILSSNKVQNLLPGTDVKENFEPKSLNFSSQANLFLNFNSSKQSSEPDFCSDDLNTNIDQENESTLPEPGFDSFFYPNVEMPVPAEPFQTPDLDLFDFHEIY